MYEVIICEYINNVKRVSSSVRSSDVLRGTIMDFCAGPQTCLWFCSCSKQRYNSLRSYMTTMCCNLICRDGQVLRCLYSLAFSLQLLAREKGGLGEGRD